MPMGTKVIARGFFPVKQVEIKQGSPYAYIATGDEVQWGRVFWEGHNYLCTAFKLFVPKDDYKYRHIIWSIRESEVYRSVDQTNFVKWQDWFFDFGVCK